MRLAPLALLLALPVTACGGSRTEAAEPAPTERSAQPTTTEPTTTETPESTSGAATSAGPSADLADYASRVMAVVRQHWSIPATLSPSETAILEASIEIQIDESSRIPTGYTVRERSGNAIFDESVERGLRALVDAAEPLPEPPVGLDDRSRIRLRLRGHR